MQPKPHSLFLFLGNKAQGDEKHAIEITEAITLLVQIFSRPHLIIFHEND